LSDENIRSALERFYQLVNDGAKQPNSGTSGILSAADWDEIGFLARFSQSELPARALDLATGGFARNGSAQKQNCERILRALSLRDKYGVIPTVQEQEASDALEPTFSLEADDKARIFELSATMRKIVFASIVFDEAHKRRLLNRISAIENQVKQPKGKLDVILAGVSDVGDTLKKFGQDLKPLSDRMAEIRKIAQSGSNEYEQIPAPEEIDALPPPEQFDPDE